VGIKKYGMHALLFSGKNYWVRPEKTEKKISLAKNTLFT